MFKSKLKKGDTVIVIAGKSKGHIGKITKIITARKDVLLKVLLLLIGTKEQQVMKRNLK